MQEICIDIKAFTKSDGAKIKKHKRCYKVDDFTESQKLKLEELKARIDNGDDLDSQADDLVEKARLSGDEVNKLGKEFAEKYGGTVTPINFKEKDRILEKLIKEEGGDILEIKDAVRNTVVVSLDNYDKLISELQSDPRFSEENGGRVKIQDGNRFFGYKGVVTNITTKQGIKAEMQVNIAPMIYAKSKKKDAIFLMGEKRYNEIAKKSGLPGGRGHDLYAKIRSLSDGPKRNKLIDESRDYYQVFRDLD